MIYSDYKFHVPFEKQVRVITNTDAKNEADDQFAIVQTLLSPKLDNVGFIAAHYGTKHADAMERSYRELETIFDKMGFDKAGMLYRGAPHAIPTPKRPSTPRARSSSSARRCRMTPGRCSSPSSAR